MNRSETTNFLSNLVRPDKFVGYWADEVTVNWGEPDECRVDFMRFDPLNTSPMGIDHGDFYVYEVKSCMEDYRSGHGLNCIGDYNYIVCPAELAPKIHPGVY